MTMEIDVREILNRLRRPIRRYLARADEASQALRHFDVHQMGRVEFVLVSEEPRFDLNAERRLQQELQKG